MPKWHSKQMYWIVGRIWIDIRKKYWIKYLKTTSYKLLINKFITLLVENYNNNLAMKSLFYIHQNVSDQDETDPTFWVIHTRQG